MAQLKPSPSKQAYNDVLDCRLFGFLGFSPGSIMTTHRYLELISEKTPGIEKICTHPKEDAGERLAGLQQGFILLGINS
jgi:hypothetical protein